MTTEMVDKRWIFIKIWLANFNQHIINWPQTDTISHDELREQLQWT